jgi:hypothetical protein
MDSLKFHPARHARPLYTLQEGHPGVGGRPAPVFFPLGYPFPYGPASQHEHHRNTVRPGFLIFRQNQITKTNHFFMRLNFVVTLTADILLKSHRTEKKQ